MPAVNSPSPAPAAPDVDPTQAVRLLEMELARARAQRLARGPGVEGTRQVLRALCVLFLLVLIAGGIYAFWRAQELRGEVRRGDPNPTLSAPSKRP